MQFSGINGVLYYTPQILEQAGVGSRLSSLGLGSTSSSFLISAVTTLLMLPCIAIAMRLMDISGRRYSSPHYPFLLTSLSNNKKYVVGVFSYEKIISIAFPPFTCISKIILFRIDIYNRWIWLFHSLLYQAWLRCSCWWDFCWFQCPLFSFFVFFLLYNYKVQFFTYIVFMFPCEISFTYFYFLIGLLGAFFSYLIFI